MASCEQTGAIFYISRGCFEMKNVSHYYRPFLTIFFFILIHGCDWKNGSESESPNPVIQLTKYTNSVNNVTPPGQKIQAGQHVKWTYEITNTGNTQLQNIHITDDREGYIGAIDTLSIGETKILADSGYAIIGTYTNIGRAVCAYDENDTLKAEDPDFYNGYFGGTWKASKEVIILTGFGQITLTPQSEMFLHMIFSFEENGTLTYESWTGSDKTAEEAGYESGSGTWSMGVPDFSMSLEEDDQIIEGPYSLIENTLVINTTLIIDSFGSDPIPFEMTLTKVED